MIMAVLIEVMSYSPGSSFTSDAILVYKDMFFYEMCKQRLRKMLGGNGKTTEFRSCITHLSFGS